MKKMEWTEIMKNGIVAALPVGIACAAVVAVLIYTGVYRMPNQTASQQAAIWLGCSLVVGIMGVWLWNLATSRWSWASSQYMMLTLGIAVALSVLAFLPLYGEGKGHPMAVPITALNFVEAIYFPVILSKLLA